MPRLSNEEGDLLGGAITYMVRDKDATDRSRLYEEYGKAIQQCILI
ncbi:MAG: hypothetical protein ACRCWR_04495 [Saezia sp.]